MKLRAQSGRSMTEMLGVLAIIGVLTIGAIAGYSYAVTKYKTNTLMKDLDMRAVTLSAQIERMTPPLTPGMELSTDSPQTNPLGQSVAQFISPNNADYFEVEVQKVPQDVCVQTVKEYPSASLIFVNDLSFKSDTSVCKKGDNTMNFVFPKGLGGRPLCSDKGAFDEVSYVCKCSGNTYFNPVTNDCACPAGYLWDDVGRTCVESKCGAGMFEDVTGKCVPCDTPTSYLIAGSINAQALCTACPDRYYTIQNYCALKTCVRGVSFPDATGGICLPCGEASWAQFTDTGAYTHELCNACPNRVAIGSLCLKDPPCPVGQFFGRLVHSSGVGATCLSCRDATTNILAIDDPFFAKSCNTCRNEGGQPNRTFKNGQCKKTLCDSGEFKGSDGVCYDCAEQKSIAVSAGSGCADTACGRQEVSGYCQINKCNSPDFVRLPNGECHRCDQRIPFMTDQKTCEASCPQRRWMSSGRCHLNTCVEGESYPWNGNSILCYPCAGMGDGSGVSDAFGWGKEYCEACPGNYMSGAFCYNGNSCKRGLEFRKNSDGDYRFCTSCDMVSAVNITDHPKHREMCMACASSKRFVAANYCYRCDTGDVPTITTAEERAACLACRVREVVDNKCVLKQS